MNTIWALEATRLCAVQPHPIAPTSKSEAAINPKRAPAMDPKDTPRIPRAGTWIFFSFPTMFQGCVECAYFPKKGGSHALASKVSCGVRRRGRGGVCAGAGTEVPCVSHPGSGHS